MASKAFEKPVDDDADDDGALLQAQIAVLQDQVKALLQMQTQSGGISEDRLEKILLKVTEATAQAQERAANPSNKTHPGISVFSYPEGDRARPRAFKCPMFWAGYDLQVDTTTAEEIELLNLAEPGVYRFKRTDQSDDTLTVTGERDAGETITKLLFAFPTAKETIGTLPGMAAMLRTAFKVKTPQERELEAMRQELEAMRATLHVGVSA